MSDVKRTLEASQPTLRVTQITARKVIIEGKFGLVADGQVFDYFDIRIEVPQDFPSRPALVFETGGRIPRSMDRHIIDDHGWCCITVFWHWLSLTKDASFRGFLDGPVQQFFLSQAWFELYNLWPNGEWQHGTEGLISAYTSLLWIPPIPELLIAYLEALSSPFVDNSAYCPCGSGLTLGLCHRALFAKWREQISPALASVMLGSLRPNSKVEEPASMTAVGLVWQASANG